MYKLNDLVEHKKSGVTYKVLYIHNDVLFAVNDKNVAKSMGIDDVVAAKSEREKVVEEMCLLIQDGMSYVEAAKSLYDAGYRKIVEKSSEDNDGWIEWNGGECPLSNNVAYEIKLRYGTVEKYQDMAEKHGSMWGNDHHPYDIIAYRILKND